MLSAINVSEGPGASSLGQTVGLGVQTVPNPFLPLAAPDTARYQPMSLGCRLE